MNLREELLSENSKAQCEKITAWVGASQQRFDELFYIFLHDDYKVVQRSGWPVSYCVEAHPHFMAKHYSNLLKNLQQAAVHYSVKRNAARLLQFVTIPEAYHGEVMGLCFSYVESTEEPVATKAFALTVLGKLAQVYPDIIPEIKLLIEDQLPHQTAAFKSRAAVLLKQFDKKYREKLTRQSNLRAKFF